MHRSRPETKCSFGRSQRWEGKEVGAHWPATSLGASLPCVTIGGRLEDSAASAVVDAEGVSRWADALLLTDGAGARWAVVSEVSNEGVGAVGMIGIVFRRDRALGAPNEKGDKSEENAESACILGGLGHLHLRHRQRAHYRGPLACYKAEVEDPTPTVSKTPPFALLWRTAGVLEESKVQKFVTQGAEGFQAIERS